MSRAALLLLVAASTASAQIFNCSDQGVLPYSADGRQNPPGDVPGYVEWWFFTAHSRTNDAGLAMTYHPSHNSVGFMLYLNASKPAAARVLYFGEDFNSSEATADNATLSVGCGDGAPCRNALTVLDKHTYRLEGDVPQGGTPHDADARDGAPAARMRWNLTYVQGVDAAREHADVLGIVKLDWVCYMPTAAISGSMTYDDGRGNVRVFDMGGAVGYHDHNSGKWPKKAVAELAARRAELDGGGARGGSVAATAPRPESEVESAPESGLESGPESGLPISFDYKWGSTGDPSRGIGAVYGTYILPSLLSRWSAGYLFVRAAGMRIKFGTVCEGDEMVVRPLGFISRPTGKEATGLHIKAKNAEWELEWVHRRLSSDVNPGGKGLGLVVYEQLSVHNLTLTRRGAAGGGGGRAPYTAQLVDAFGFTEWSDPR